MNHIIPILLLLLIFFNMGCDPVDPVSTSVNGKLINRNQNTPIPFKEIIIGDQKTLTGADGEFSVNGVSIPYDLAIMDNGLQRAEIFKGLTSNNPIIPTDMQYEPTISYLKVMLPGTLKQSDLYVAVFCSNGRDINFLEVLLPDKIDTTLDMYIRNNMQNQTFRIYVLTYKKNMEGEITSYENFASSTPLQLSPGSNSEYIFSASDINFNPDETIVEGRFYNPQGYQIFSDFLISFSSGKFYRNQYTFQRLNSNNFEVVVPVNLPVPVYCQAYYENYSLDFSIEVYDIYPGKYNDLIVKGPLELQSPPDESENINMNTLFSYRASEGEGIYRIHIGNLSINGSFVIYTDKNYFTLKDIEDYLFSPINNNLFYWYAEYIGNVSSIDALGKSYYEGNLSFKLRSNYNNFTTQQTF